MCPRKAPRPWCKTCNTPASYRCGSPRGMPCHFRHGEVRRVGSGDTGSRSTARSHRCPPSTPRTSPRCAPRPCILGWRRNGPCKRPARRPHGRPCRGSPNCLSCWHPDRPCPGHHLPVQTRRPSPRGPRPRSGGTGRRRRARWRRCPRPASRPRSGLRGTPGPCSRGCRRRRPCNPPTMPAGAQCSNLLSCHWCLHRGRPGRCHHQQA
mmetsp:Transcript_96926/g.301396  ORF Transcript_96926/g.301396 Transcript_96926/m.301396 type:complete len:208 (+) Transcript_96926:484-1107(+)